MNLQTFVKVNFLAGLFGTLVLSPLAYAVELVHGGASSPLLKFSLLELVMLLVVPLLCGLAFAATALAAFPVVLWLQKKGFVAFTEGQTQR